VGDVFQYLHERNYFINNSSSSTDYSYSQVVILEKKKIKDTIFYLEEIRERNHNEIFINSYIQKDTITHLDSSIFSVLKWPLPSTVDQSKYKTLNLTIFDPNSYGGGIYCYNQTRISIPISGPILSYNAPLKLDSNPT
jgi:hypothetical protein